MNNVLEGILTKRHSHTDRAASRIVVIYDDEETRKWASRAFKQAVDLVGSKNVHATWWKLADLSHPGVLAGASSMAMRAEAIIVAIASGGGLPLPFYIWADSWVTNRRVTGGHLHVMIGTADETEYQLNYHVREYFQAVAREAGLCLSLEERRLPAGPDRAIEPPNGASKLAPRPITGQPCPEPVLMT